MGWGFDVSEFRKSLALEARGGGEALALHKYFMVQLLEHCRHGIGSVLEALNRSQHTTGFHLQISLRSGIKKRV